MKRTRQYVLMLLCVVTLLGAYFGKYHLYSGAHAFSFTTNSIDLGSVENNTTITARFPFVNRSDEVIKIQRILSGCGCSKARASNNTIAPGEDGFVEVELTTRSRRGQEKHDILVLIASPCESKHTLSLSFAVDPHISLIPKTLSFGCFGKYEEVRPREALIISNVDPKATFLNAEANQPYLAVESIDTGGFDKREIGRIRIKLVSQPPDGDFKGSVDVCTKTDEGTKITTLQVVGSVENGPSS